MNDAALRLMVGIRIESVRESSPVVRCLVPASVSGWVGEALAAVGAVPLLADAATPSTGEVESVCVLDTVRPRDEALALANGAAAEGHPWVLHVEGDVDASGLADLGPTITWGAPGPGVGLVPGTPTLVYSDGRELRVDLPQVDLSRVYGIQAVATALTAACAAVSEPVEAAIAASAWLMLAAERAAAHARGPASLKVALIDELSLLGGDEVAERVTLA